MSFPAAFPHGPITKTVDGVYAVRGGFQMGPGMLISRTMTIVASGRWPRGLQRSALVGGRRGTFIACDALQNHADTEGTSFLARIMTPLMGFKGGVIVAPMWCKYQKLSGPHVKNAFADVSAQPFANLVTGHGPAVIGDADARVRAAIEAASV